MFNSPEAQHISIDGTHVGRMVLSPQRLCVFEYDAEFLANGFSISPFYLPLRSGVFTAQSDPFGGLFGIFNDSLPDGWGNLLIDRYLISKEVVPGTLSVIDRLSIVGSSGMGALDYMPDNSIKSSGDIVDINTLAYEINQIVSDVEFTGDLDVLVEKGGSSGGARPKVLINIDNKPWIVKFRSAYDPKEIGEIEYKYSLVAKKCSIEMPETMLLEGKYFGVQRFDRVKNRRIHMHTASGLLYASHRYPSLDYIDLIKATLALTKNMEEAFRLFRLMVFNILTGNMDDHAKNFSFIYEKGNWMLSPAYDLVLSTGFNGNHSTTIAGNGKPTKENIFDVVKQCGLKYKTALNIYDDVYFNCEEIRTTDW